MHKRFFSVSPVWWWVIRYSSSYRFVLTYSSRCSRMAERALEREINVLKKKKKKMGGKKGDKQFDDPPFIGSWNMYRHRQSREQQTKMIPFRLWEKMFYGRLTTGLTGAATSRCSRRIDRTNCCLYSLFYFSFFWKRKKKLLLFLDGARTEWNTSST